jgi:hypothetical protein
MSEELKQVSGEAETVADTDAMHGAAASTVEGSAGSDSALGQAARVITPPAAGQTDVVRLAPGERFELAANPATVKLVVDGNNLVLGFDLDGDGAPDSFVVLEDLVLAAGSTNPPVLMVAGEPIGVDLLIGNALALSGPQTDGPGATLETAAEPAGAQGTGATVYSDNLGDAIDLLVAQGVIPPVELEFGLIELEDEIFIVEEDNEPPLADPVLTPASLADGGEGGGLPADLVEALSQVGAVIVSETVTIAGPNLPGSVQYVYFTLTEPTAVTIFTDGPTIDPQIYLFVDDGSLDIGDILATDDDDGSPAGSFSNSIINTGDEIGILPAGNYVVAVSDFSLSAAEAVAGLNDSTDLTGDVTVTVLAQPAPDSVIFFKQLDVDGSVGDDDSGIVADFGGADTETSLENLVFTLLSNPTFGQLILVTAGGDTSFLTPGDTFSSEDTVWWIATEDQIADFLALPGAPEFLPDVNFNYSVTDEAGGVATAPVVITLPPPSPPRTALGIEQDDCLNEDTEGSLLFAAYPTDGASKISQIVISGFPTGDAADAWMVDETSVDIFGYALGIDYTTSYNALTGELTIDFITASFSLGESVQGTVDVTPNPDSDVDQTLTIEATAINGAGSETDIEDSLIPVDADADGAEGGAGDDGDGVHLSVVATASDSNDDGNSFQPDEVGSLNIQATFDDFLDGSETHTIQVFAPGGFTILAIDPASLPAGVTLVSNDGSIAIFDIDTTDGLGSVDFDIAIQNTGAEEGTADFLVRALAEETNTGDVECVDGGEGGLFPVEGDNVAFVEDEAGVTVADVAPPEVSLSLYGGEDCIEEDSTASDFTNQVTLTVNPDGDDLLTEIVISGLQSDWSYDFSGLEVLGATLTDSDPSDGSITLSVPNLAGYTGTFGVQPPADSDVDHPTITATASVMDPVDNALTDSGDGTIDIHVDANADAGPGATGGTNDGDPEILSISIDDISDSGDAGGSFQVGESGTVTLTATFDDFLDGSETHEFTLTAPAGFEIAGVNAASLPLPAGVTFDLALDGSSITFFLPTDSVDGLEGLTVTVDITNVSAEEGSPTFEASATATETLTGDVECDPSESDNVATVSDEQSVTLASVAPPTVLLTLPDQVDCIEEDSLVDDASNVVTLTVTPDGDDEITEIVISGLQSDWTYDFSGLEVLGATLTDSDPSDGSITLSVPNLTGYTGTFGVQPPADSDVDHPTVTATATVVDGVDPALTDSGNGTLDIHVDANADAGPGATGGTDDGDGDDLSIAIDSITDAGGNGSFQAGESGTITVTATFDDYLDGSETHEFTVTAPAGFTIDGIDAPATLPDGVTFDLAGDGSSITFFLPTDSVDGLGSLTVTLDITNESAGEGDHTFEVSAKATETQTGDEECDPSEADNIATVSAEQSVTVAGIAAPTVSINLEDDATYIKEDSEDNVVEFTAATGDASDELTTVVITFPPEVAIGDVDFSTVASHADVSNVDIDDNGGAGPVVATIAFDPGVTSFSGSFTLDAPDEDSDVDLGDITIVANVQDQVDNSLTDSANATLQIDVDAVLDEALDPGADSVVNETETAGAQTINLGLISSLVSAGFVNDPPLGGDSGSGGADTDGSELISAFLVLDSELPAGVTLSSTGGTVTQDLLADPTGKTYVITGGDLQTAIDGLQVELPGSFEGSITGTVTVTSAEANTPEGEEAASGAEPDETDNVVVLSADFTVNVADGADPTGDELSLTADEAALDEEQDGNDLAAGTTFGNNAGSTAETDSGGLTINAGADPIVDITFGATGGIVVEDENGDPIGVIWSGTGTDTLTGTLNGVTVIILSLTGDNTAPAGGSANVTVTVTLTDAFPHDFGNTGDVTITGIEVDAEDDDGDTATSLVDVTVLDDEPNDISPEAAALGSSTGSTFTGDLDFYDNVGADKPGDVVFDPSLHGDTLMEDDGVTPVTSNGDAIILDVSGDGHTLTGYVESGANAGYQEGEDGKVFTVVLNPDTVNEGDDEYTITLFDEIDTGGGLLFDNFGDVDAGGPNEFIALDDPRTGAEDLGEDILITASPETELVNASTQGVGVQNQQVDDGETIRIDFVSDVVGLTDATPGIKDDFDNLTYSGHRTVNDSGFNISQDFGPTTVTVRALDADDDKDFGGDADDVQRNITLVTVISATGIVLLDNVAANASNGGVSVTFNGDGTVTVTGLLEDYQVLVSTAEGFDALEITAVDSKFDLGGIVTSSAQAGEPVDLDFGLIATDEDGDTSSGTLEVAVLPQIDGGAGADNLVAGSNGGNIQAGDGNDTLVGGVANDLLQGEGGADTISDGDGNDTIIGGAGADVINLANDGDTDILVYNAIGEAGDVVSGFSTAAPSLGGLGGDVVDLVDLLDGGSFTGTTLAEAEADGYVQLFQSGGNVEVRVDLDGGADSFTTIVTINSVTVADLSDNIVVD